MINVIVEVKVTVNNGALYSAKKRDDCENEKCVRVIFH